MADFDNMLNKLKDFTKTAAYTVETKTQEAKLRFTLRSLKQRAEAQYTAIGKSVYENFKSGAEQEDFSELFGRIDAINDEIEELRERIKKVKEDE